MNKQLMEKFLARRRKMLKEANELYDKINNYLIKIGEEPLDDVDDIEEDFSMEDDILNEAKADVSLEKGTLGEKGVKQLLAPYKNELKNIFNRWFKYCGRDFIGPLIRRNVVGMPIEFDLLGFYMLKLLARATKTNTETVCDALNKEGLEYITDFVATKTQKLFGSSYGDSNFPKTSQITQEVINEVKKLAKDLCGGDSALESKFLSEWKKYIKSYRKDDMPDEHKRRAAKLPEKDPLLDESFKRIKKPANLLESLNRGFEQIYGKLDDDRRLTIDKKFKNKNESIGSDVAEYQKWVDYDMKRYGKISERTMSDIEEAGLSVVKDQYGDYEVIAEQPIREAVEYRKGDIITTKVAKSALSKADKRKINGMLQSYYAYFGPYYSVRINRQPAPVHYLCKKIAEVLGVEVTSIVNNLSDDAESYLDKLVDKYFNSYKGKVRTYLGLKKNSNMIIFSGDPEDLEDEVKSTLKYMGADDYSASSDARYWVKHVNDFRSREKPIAKSDKKYKKKGRVGWYESYD